MAFKGTGFMIISMILSAYILNVYCSCPRDPIGGCGTTALKEYTTSSGERCYQCDDTKPNACSIGSNCPADCFLSEMQEGSNLCHICACA